MLIGSQDVNNVNDRFLWFIDVEIINDTIKLTKYDFGNLYIDIRSFNFFVNMVIFKKNNINEMIEIKAGDVPIKINELTKEDIEDNIFLKNIYNKIKDNTYFHNNILEIHKKAENKIASVYSFDFMNSEGLDGMAEKHIMSELMDTNPFNVQDLTYIYIRVDRVPVYASHYDKPDYNKINLG
jgi:hypothetical protein